MTLADLLPPCAAKKAWLTKREAKKWAKRIAQRLHSRRFRVYHCPHCFAYHTTSQNLKALGLKR